MSLASGTRLGPFEVGGAVGAGGMGEVYRDVRPFPGSGGRWQVSTDGGWKPMWSRRRNEPLFFDDLRRLAPASQN